MNRERFRFQIAIEIGRPGDRAHDHSYERGGLEEPGPRFEIPSRPELQTLEETPLGRPAGRRAPACRCLRRSPRIAIDGPARRSTEWCTDQRTVSQASRPCLR